MLSHVLAIITGSFSAATTTTTAATTTITADAESRSFLHGLQVGDGLRQRRSKCFRRRGKDVEAETQTGDANDGF